MRKFFDDIKDKKTCKSFFGYFSKLSEWSLPMLDEPARVIFNDISIHCPSYRFILSEPFYVRFQSRGAIFLTEIDRIDLNAAEDSKSGIERAWLDTFRDVGCSRHMDSLRGSVFDRMLNAIDYQAVKLEVDMMEFRAGILPHLKLAIAYSEAE